MASPNSSALTMVIDQLQQKGSNVHFSGRHISERNTFSFDAVIQNYNADLLQVGGSYIGINFTAVTREGDKHNPHLLFMRNSNIIPIAPQSLPVNNYQVVGRAAANSTSNTYDGNTVTNFRLVSNFWDFGKKAEAVQGFSCSYWNKFSQMKQGDQFIVTSELQFKPSRDGKKYFNLRVLNVEYGAESRANRQAREKQAGYADVA